MENDNDDEVVSIILKRRRPAVVDNEDREVSLTETLDACDGGADLASGTEKE